MGEWLQSNLGSNIAGGLVVVIVVAIVPKLRHLATTGVARAWRWLTSIRVTTTTRIAKLVSEAEERADSVWLEQHSQATQLAGRTEADDDWEPWTEAHTNEYVVTSSANSDSIDSLKKPRWLIAPFLDFGGGKKTYYVQNLLAAAEVRDVRIEDPHGRVVFHDAAAWDDVPSDGVGRQFTATSGYGLGIVNQLEVHWTDAHGGTHVDLVQLAVDRDDDYVPF